MGIRRVGMFRRADGAVLFQLRHFLFFGLLYLCAIATE